VVPVLVVATAERLGARNETAAKVDAWHVVDDGADVRELHVLLRYAFTATATS